MTAEHLKTLKHELRTPINHISGYSELLLESATEDDNPEMAAMASSIRSTGQSLATRIDKHLLGEPNKIGLEQMLELRADMMPVLEHAIAGRSQLEQLACFSTYSDDLRKIYAALEQLREAVEAELIVGHTG